MTWSEAYAVCFKEQSYLAVVNSPAEATYFTNLMREESNDKRLRRNVTGVIYLGFQNINGESWTTIKGFLFYYKIHKFRLDFPNF